MNELVSIIIPTYKRANRLEQAIKSALEQTYSNVEVLVIDDNDPGTQYRKNVEEIVFPFLKLGNFKYIQHECNRNGAVARNTGLRNSSGQYICFLDDDDLYRPEKVEKQVLFMNNNVFYNACYCWRHQKGKDICGHYSGDLSKEILLGVFSPTTPCLMFTRESLEQIQGFNEKYRRHQDYELLLRFFQTFTIGVVESIQVDIGSNDGENELHGDELERCKKEFLSDFANVLSRIDNSEKGFKKNVFTTHYVEIAADHLTHHHVISGFWYLGKSLLISPVHTIRKFVKMFFSYLMHLLT